MQQDLRIPAIWPACERLLAPEITLRIQQHAALQRAEERARLRLRELRYIDTRPPLIRSEAFAEDLVDLLGPSADAELGEAVLRGLAGVV